MPTTSNFGWTTPADTDLVKDGAAAIRTLGNGIDTSLVDLKGGTTGQVLSKTSNTDLDFTWVTSAGDIEGVTAGTGISGGGTSGTVTITNSMATAIDAKGDLIVGTGADAFSRLAVGATNGHTLQVDSTTSTGLKWAAAPAPAFKGCYITGSGDINVNNTTQTVLSYDSETYDTDGFHDNSVNNSRITIPAGLGGYYIVNSKFSWNTTNTTGRRSVEIRKNGTTALGNVAYAATQYTGGNLSFVVNLSAGDYIETRAWQDSGGALNANNHPDNGWFQVTYLGA